MVNWLNKNMNLLLYIIIGIFVLYSFFALLPIILAVALISFGIYKLIKVFKKPVSNIKNKTSTEKVKYYINSSNGEEKVIDVDYKEL